VKTLKLDERSEKIYRWLSPPDPSTNFINALKQRQKGSGLWFLKGDTFAKWKTRRNSFLWLHGIPGCGKTILSSTIVDELQTSLSSRTLLYFYFDFNDNRKQTLDSTIRSLISQLYHLSDVNFKLLESLFSSCEAGRHQPSCESLHKVLLQIIEEVKEVWIVLDALDECRTRRGPPTEGLLSWLKDLLNSEQRNIHLLVTSRPEQDIKSAISELACNDDIISIQSELISDDIHAYVHTRVREDDGLKRWRSKPKIQDEIVTVLTAKAGGM
jgi:Cdc6-like AAA superfamily ATPase